MGRFGWPWAKRSSHAFAHASPVQMTTRKPLLITVPFVKIKCGLHKATTILFLLSSLRTDASSSIRKLSAGRYSFSFPGTNHFELEGSIERAFQSLPFGNLSVPFSFIHRPMSGRTAKTISLLPLSIVLHPNNGSLLLQLVLGESSTCANRGTRIQSFALVASQD